MYKAQIEFRGELKDVVVTKHNYDKQTDSYELDWTFDGITPEEQTALNMTPDEDYAILEALTEYW